MRSSSDLTQTCFPTFPLLVLSHFSCFVLPTACLTRPKHAPSFFSTATIVPFVLFFSVVLTKCLEQAKSVVVGRNTVSTMKVNILKKKFSSILRNENHTIIKPYCQPHCQFTNLHYGPEMKNSRLNWMATLYQQKPWVTTYVNLVRKYF